jgi:methylmalonyl-CoA/ethylmalonyl-CoA epimerase
MILKIDHIGIAVNHLGISNEIFTRLLGKEHYKTEDIESEKVKTSFFKSGESKIELLEAINNEGSIAKYILKKGEGIHHIAFEVDDIESEILRLKKEGFTFINEEPKSGADQKKVCFIHPKDTNGVLIELCQTIK